MLTRAAYKNLSTQESVVCRSEGCKFYGTADNRFVCSTCYTHPAPYRNLVEVLMPDMGVERMSEQEVRALGHIGSASGNRPRLMLKAYRELVEVRNAPLMCSAEQANYVLGPDETLRAANIVLSMCYEPWKVSKARVHSAAMCYYGNMGDPVQTLAEARRVFENCANLRDCNALE